MAAYYNTVAALADRESCSFQVHYYRAEARFQIPRLEVYDLVFLRLEKQSTQVAELRAVGHYPRF